jgi:putative sterol carrier protein
MEDLKNMVKSLDGADAAKLKEDIPKIMDKVKEIGFVEVIRDDDLKDFIPELTKQITTIPVDDLIPLAKVLMPAFFEGMAELLENSEEAMEEIEEMESMKLMMEVPALDIKIFLQVEDGKFSAGMGDVEGADLTITIQKDTFLQLMSGEVNMMNAYLGGGMSAEGTITKALALQTLFEILVDEYDFEMLNL